jgi:hypothetical protein
MKKQIDIKVLQTPKEQDPTDDLFGDWLED